MTVWKSMRQYQVNYRVWNNQSSASLSVRAVIFSFITSLSLSFSALESPEILPGQIPQATMCTDNKEIVFLQSQDIFSLVITVVYTNYILCRLTNQSYGRHSP